MTTEKQAKPIVVAVDGTEDSLNAARWAAGLALSRGEPLCLVHSMTAVDEALLVAVDARRADDAGEFPRALGQAVLERAAETVRADFPALHVSRTLSHSSARDALIDQSRHARMVVLACSDVSTGGALFVGSTTLAVTTHAECPVVAWRGSAVAPNDRPVVVGVGIDDDHTSQEALETAFELSNSLGVGLTAVHVMTARRPVGDVDLPFLIDWDALEAEARDRLVDMVAPVARRWPHVVVSHAVEKGRTSRGILGRASGAQLIVVGSRRRGALASALLGSTALGLLHHARVPVVICPGRRTPATADARHEQPGSV